MSSPADAQAEAIADVERIAREFYYAAEQARFGGAIASGWEQLPERVREGHRAVVQTLLLKDVVRVGRRPETGPEPMANQLIFISEPARER